MAHEISATDHVVLHRERAWHGLGTVVADAPTPAAAVKLARLDWTVEQWPMAATDGVRRIAVGGGVLNVRVNADGSAEELGVVGKGYRPLQNSELADFAAALAMGGDVVKVETAGSIRGGRKVWFLLQGESFSVRGEDEIKPYILLSNGHDGATSIRCTPTTIRVVCSNTLHMVIPSFEAEGRRQSAKAACFVARHSGDLAAKVDEARAALGLYSKSLEKQREVIDHLALRTLDTEAVTRFLGECYARHFGAIPANPQTGRDKTIRDKAIDAIGSMLARFDREAVIGGATAWNAVNAYTGWLQHDRQTRGKDAAAKADARTASRLFGTAAEQSLEALVWGVQAL